MLNVSMAAVVLQQEGIYSNHDLIQVVSSALVTIALLVQAVVVVVFVVGAMKTKKELTALLRELHGRALPLIDTTNDLMQENAPRIRTIAKNMVETSHIVREKAVEMDSVVSDATRRAKAQTARVDGLVTNAITRTESITEQLHRAVMVPVKQFSGLMNGLLAAIEALRTKTSHFTGAADEPKSDQTRTSREEVERFDKNYPAKGEDYHA